ncbi:hypothetical protein AaE_011749 [Aphanomyces astaci]|uniref:HTH CENPB-type domain-containing protein n=1 Tax=Aphanomyces astaci TaxID=112090 RepID=A0A6A4ZTR1_APHAT|nr:hypothetical protein AaE_011749 [Aphanomyces astaci]
MLEWVLRCEDLGVCIMGELIRKQSPVLCDQMDVSPAHRIPFSKGWLYKFQLMYGHTSKVQHGEAAVTRRYDAKNIYNMNETALFYCVAPHRSITRNRQPGTKKSKKRITIALTTNVDGSELVHPLFIGTAARPHCFNGIAGTDFGFDYLASKRVG